MLAMAALMSSKSGLPNWNAGLACLNLDIPLPPQSLPPLWPDLPESLAAELARFDRASVGRALDRAVIAAAGDFADGVAAYRHHPYRRASEDDRAVWREGGTALLDHGADTAGAGDVPALFVPSLVNRGWVLDLVPGQGMMSWLARHGIRPYRMEWGFPGDDERQFDIAAYVRTRLEPALDEVARRSGRPPMLVGYCMGGLLALAAAVRRPDAIAGLVLLATPWDFHADGPARSKAIGAFYRICRPFLGALNEFPVDLIQALFAMHDPIVALRKFRRFASMDPTSPEAEKFVALEDWLNDGVALPLPVADEALLGWYEGNLTGRGAWTVGGTAINPAAVMVPTLVVVPGGDRLVPPASAAAVLSNLGDATRLDLPLGHIGMVVGRDAEHALWSPLATWIRALA
ncbi:MAG: poly-beta-hydroxybutyrate polymerase [Rhodospirillales bacterium]|nr:poly-beta-hydroxybutyrate polymerase [Rhodospirillales bacterium]